MERIVHLPCVAQVLLLLLLRQTAQLSLRPME
jgi:hypothetical protein